MEEATLTCEFCDYSAFYRAFKKNMTSRHASIKRWFRERLNPNTHESMHIPAQAYNSQPET